MISPTNRMFQDHPFHDTVVDEWPKLRRMAPQRFDPMSHWSTEPAAQRDFEAAFGAIENEPRDEGRNCLPE